MRKNALIWISGAFLFIIYLFLLHLSLPQYIVAHTWRSEDTLEEGVLSFFSVGTKDWTQVTRLGNKHFYPHISQTQEFFKGSHLVAVGSHLDCVSLYAAPNEVMAPDSVNLKLYGEWGNWPTWTLQNKIK